jgi:hypothetical protein
MYVALCPYGIPLDEVTTNISFWNLYIYIPLPNLRVAVGETSASLCHWCPGGIQWTLSAQ